MHDSLNLHISRLETWVRTKPACTVSEEKRKKKTRVVKGGGVGLVWGVNFTILKIMRPNFLSHLENRLHDLERGLGLGLYSIYKYIN